MKGIDASGLSRMVRVSVHCVVLLYSLHTCEVSWGDSGDDDSLRCGSVSDINWKKKNKHQQQKKVKLREINLAGVNQVEDLILTDWKSSSWGQEHG